MLKDLRPLRLVWNKKRKGNGMQRKIYVFSQRRVMPSSEVEGKKERMSERIVIF